jgi:AbrB family looped-hinge helix DNA binding protein
MAAAALCQKPQSVAQQRCVRPICMKSMNSPEKPPEHRSCGITDAFYGSSTVGERGQIVIPAEARAEMGIGPGDKLLIMRHPVYKGLMLCKIEAVREFLDEFQKGLEEIADREEAE